MPGVARPLSPPEPVVRAGRALGGPVAGQVAAPVGGSLAGQVGGSLGAPVGDDETGRSPVPRGPVRRGPTQPGAAGRAAGRDATAALAVPDEPGRLAGELHLLALDAPAMARDEMVVVLAARLWRTWRADLLPLGWSRARLTLELADYRRELWLWAIGERRWEPTIDALAGRVARRAGTLRASRAATP